MSADRMEDLHRELDGAIARAKSSFGRSYPLMIGGREVRASSEFDDRSPIDTRMLLGTFQSASRQQVSDAIGAAKAAFPAWSARPWRERVSLLKKAADAIRERRWQLSALMGYEAGKNRLECVGDVEESADLIEYYCEQLEKHEGFATRLGTLGPNEENFSVLRPYGVWAVISPFNFPLALAAGPSGGALAAGNTVVFKPASVTPLLGYKLYEMMKQAGVPDGVFNFITGGGGTAGQELIDNKDVDGIVFTGSKDVGMHLIRDNATRAIPPPLVIEMGGKNPALVMRSADLDKATDALRTSAPRFADGLVVPITVVCHVPPLREAIALANSTERGLTAGIFSEDDREVEQFFSRIQAGVTYVNRRAGGPTGAWPGINSFGGWKASGSTGRGTGGPYYVQQFMREQSRVRIR